ncbi:2-C-methyl-D-erythritol 4-phosphate cytidylyltransferase [Ructibacterium gallinarum]|uniref:2-C-methyl-D-erythritol 4-phosphate cytidylyltransferase n=1 Tax=Ructibacterium gallinarum TaxID=2779355 RepID=A0A9D5R9D3_9FIRM|nr:2-C-methyl-D-erythritol 4-phosphate cytidylyltransferase [Ructibacterium gallinarum]MBE5040374.1 2-C-methyl-D-erythritol 4-phosphate cytidylyltransferase [Ructibacterium gallinarum]
MKHEKQDVLQASVIIAAAGTGSRMGAGVNKQFLMLGDMPVLAHTLFAFENAELISEIVISAKHDEIVTISHLIQDFDIRKVKAIVPGGETRQESVRLGLEHVTSKMVLVHDGARPFVEEEQILTAIRMLHKHQAVTLGVPVKDTIKRVDSHENVCETLERSGLFQIQTPQGFRTDVLRKAHQKALKEEFQATDDAALAEYIGVPVHVISGSVWNLKLTTPEDLVMGRAILAARTGE